MRRASSRSLFSSLPSRLSFVSLLAVSSIARAQVGEPLPPPPPPPPGTPAPPPTTTPTPAPAPAPGSAPAPARPARGEPRGGADYDSVPSAETPHMLRSAVGLEAYWWSAKRVESALPIVPFAAFNVSPSLVLDFHLPISFVINARVGGETKAVAGLGNPTVGLTYVTSPDTRWTWFIGGRVSAPLAGASDSQAWQTANLLSAVSMAVYDLHYWAYKYLPIGARGGFEFRPKDRIYLRGSLDPTLYIPLDAERSTVVTNTRTAELFYQMRLEIEGRSQSGWGGGAGLQVVHALSAGDTFGRGDNAQGAFEPFVSYTSSSTFARLGCLIALDSPFGLGFDSGTKVAALRLGVGTYF